MFTVILVPPPPVHLFNENQKLKFFDQTTQIFELAIAVHKSIERSDW